MEKPTDNLSAFMLSDGSARFDLSFWLLHAGSELSLTRHEQLHSSLNDTTAFGLVLSWAAYLARREGGDQVDLRVLERLVGRCRLTHETYATFLSSVSSLSAPRELIPNEPEYRAYYEVALEVCERLPTLELGAVAVSTLARIAMNCPLPDHFTASPPDRLDLREFRAGDSPDHRFRKCVEVLDEQFWSDAYLGAQSLFGAHRDWDLWLDKRSDYFDIRRFLKLEPDGDSALVSPASIDPELETAVGNFFVDQAATHLSAVGLRTLTLRERLGVEATYRGLIPDQPRFYDDPASGQAYNNLRVFVRERVLLRPAPITTVVSHPEALADAWGKYANIIKEEGSLPVYLTSIDDFLLNHAVSPSASLPDRGPICYLRRKTGALDSGIGLNVHVLEGPEELNRLYFHTSYFDAVPRLCVSGRVVSRAHEEAVAPWFEAAQGMPLSILLDTPPSRIWPSLAIEPQALTWHLLKPYDDAPESVLVVYPVGQDAGQLLGFYRPANHLVADATIRLFEPLPIPLTNKALGVEMDGLPVDIVESSWKLPEHLLWTAARHLSEEFIFSASFGRQA